MERPVHMKGDGWLAVMAALGAASLGCVGLVTLRVFYTREPAFAFLVWNLALAWVPFVLAVAVYGGYRNGANGAYLICMSLLWLLFLPNAPYIVTDFIHLRWQEGVPLWFDALSVAAYAGTGLLLGFASLYLMQFVAARTVGERMAWSWAVGVLCLSSVGIYLGRFQRLNSWDAIRHPRLILDMVSARLQDPFANETLLTVTIAFSAFLVVSYVVIYALVLPRLEWKPRGVRFILHR
jgi:uncharacterized membrane protein